MTIYRGWTWAGVLFAVFVMATSTEAQMGPMGPAARPMSYGAPAPGMYGYGAPMARPAMYGAPVMSPYGPRPNAVAPAGFMAPGGCSDCGPGGCGGLLGGGSGLFGLGCGPRGCGPYGNCGSGLVAGCLGALLPNGDGGNCAPRWFDVHAEFLMLKRDEVGSSTDFTSDVLGGGNIVLSTDDLDFSNERPGIRLTGAYQTGPGSNLEIGYLGTFHWGDSAVATSNTDNLFSIFSDFGNSPFNGFDSTDRAELHSIHYQSELNALELNYRRRFVGANCRVHGSWLVGFRWWRLNEEFTHRTSVDRPDMLPNPDIVGDMNYEVATVNNLYGAQIGGDLWLSVIPGVKVGSEFKAGIFGNDCSQDTNITGNDPAGGAFALRERGESDELSFAGEAALMAIWRYNHNLTFRFGYEFILLDQVALASENFNSDPPMVFSPPPPALMRTVDLDENGNVFYHGYTAGIEWIW